MSCDKPGSPDFTHDRDHRPAARQPRRAGGFDRALAQAIGVMIDAEVARCPGITALELCGVLGAAAGTVVGLSLPESDLDVMSRCFWASVDEVERPVRQ